MRYTTLDMKKTLYLAIGTVLTVCMAVTSLAKDGGRFNGIKAKFELRNAAGQLVTEKDLKGRYTLLAFGFTHCLHICPMMAANMAMALKASKEDSLGVFISVDTERDTAAVTQAYAAAFHPAMMGLSGSYEQIRQAANNFSVNYVVTKSQKAYTVEHTSDIFLIGPDGKVLEVFALNASPKAMADAMHPTVE